MTQKNNNAIRLTLRKCESLGDWWVIERAEHDGREWMERSEPNMLAIHTSARFSDNADVEGTSEEMLEIAKAIKARDKFSAKRCAVDATDSEVYFSSPRNSAHDGTTTIEFADELADLIEAKCGGNSTDVV